MSTMSKVTLHVRIFKKYFSRIYIKEVSISVVDIVDKYNK